MHQQRINTLTQVNAKVPVNLLKISEPMRKLLWLVKNAGLDLHREYTVEEVEWHWKTSAYLPQLAYQLRMFTEETGIK